MCGIAGVVNTELSPEELEAALARMERSLFHRGPDEGGVLAFPAQRAGLAARRLAIVDLQGGRQPMPNEDGTVHAVLNGEIYNHAELRRDLESRGHRFKSRSDTEAVVHLYEEHGVACLDLLHGMFGLAVFDSRRRRLLLARDGPGMKPLYFAETGCGFLFGSEAKALFASGLVRPEPNLAAIDTYLALGYVPTPMSAFQGVEKLRPGCFVVVEPSGVRRGEFWRFRHQEPSPSKSDAEYVDELDSLLSRAVRSHLAADVPVGAFLSGGWDSSLTAAYAARHTGKRLQTFSIVFPGEPKTDESQHARLMSAFLGAGHHEVEFQPASIPDAMPRIARHLEEPCSNVPVAVVYALTSLGAQHLKTVVSGEGSDELFAGYHYFRSGQSYPIRRFTPRGPARFAARFVKNPRVRRALRFLGAPDERTADAEWFRVFSPAEKRRLLKPEYWNEGPDLAPAMIPDEVLSTCRDVLQRRLALDFTGRLADGILFMSDKMSMSHSLEVRMPFLDRAVVDFALRLPSRLKMCRGREKVVLSALAKRHLPPGIAARRKQGLGYPPRVWTTPPVDRYVRELLLDGPGPFDVASVERLILQTKNGGRPYALPINRVVFLQAWWNEFISANGAK